MRLALLLVLATVLGAATTDLEWLGRGGVLLGIDNDAPAGSDDRYTAGTRLSLLTPDLRDFERSLPLGLGLGLGVVPGFATRGRQRYLSLQLAQYLFTPQRLDSAAPIVDDLPYAAVLSLGLSAVVQDERRLQAASLVLGLVGPSAGGEPVQRTVHRLTDSTPARGWHHQAGDQAVASLAYEHRERLWSASPDRGLGGDLIARGSLRLGNLVSATDIGLALRWGANLPQDFALPAPLFADDGVGVAHYGRRQDTTATYATLVLGASAWGWLAPVDLLDGPAGSRLERLPVSAYGFAGLTLHHRRLLLRGGIEAITVPWQDDRPVDWFGRMGLGYRL